MSETQKIDDGGSAFPFGDYQNGGEPGMKLRDYFAAAALQGIVSNLHCTPQVTYKEVAIRAYEQADAIIAARKEGNQP